MALETASEVSWFAKLHAQAVDSEAFQDFLANIGATALNLSGDEAAAYLQRWQSITAWAMYEAGSLEESPELLGIAKP